MSDFFLGLSQPAFNTILALATPILVAVLAYIQSRRGDELKEQASKRDDVQVFLKSLLDRVENQEAKLDGIQERLFTTQTEKLGLLQEKYELESQLKDREAAHEIERKGLLAKIVELEKRVLHLEEIQDQLKKATLPS